MEKASSARASTGSSAASATSAGGASARKPSLVISDAEWDRLRKRDLFSPELVKDSNIPSNVHVQALAGINSELQSMADIDSLLPVMKKRCILTPHMESVLRCKATPRCDKVTSLSLDLRGQGKVLVEELFLCFLDCHERQIFYNDYNFLLADGLKRSALEVSGVHSDRQEKYKQQNCIHNAIETIGLDVEIDGNTAAELSKNLRVCMNKTSWWDSSVTSICERWRQENPTGTVVDLTRALLSIRGLGRLVSGFCPPTSSNPPIVRRMISGLKKDWPKFAHHLGYTHEETASITKFSPDVSKQIEMFLRVFQMPNLGDDTESVLLNAIKLVRPRCNTVGLTDQPAQAQAMSASTYIHHMSVVNNIVFSPRHHRYPTRTVPSCLPQECSSNELSVAQFIGVSSEPQSETETDAGSVTTSEVSSRCTSPLSMTGHEQRGIDHQYSTSNSGREKQPWIGRPTHDQLSSPNCKNIRTLRKPAPPSGDGPTEGNRQKQRELDRKKQKVTSSDSEEFQEYMTPHYQQGPPKRPTTQPLIGSSIHDRLSSTSDKKIRSPIKPVPTSGDRPTYDKKLKQRQLTIGKKTVTSGDSEGFQGNSTFLYQEGPPDRPTTQMLPTVTNNDLEGFQEYTTPHYQQGPPESSTTQPLIERSPQGQLSYPSVKKIRDPIEPARKSDDQLIEDKKQMMMEDFENIPIKISNQDICERFHKELYRLNAAYILSQTIYMRRFSVKKALQSLSFSDDTDVQLLVDTAKHSQLALHLRVVHLQEENRSLREENQLLRQSQRHSPQEGRSRFHETPGPTKVLPRNRPSRIPKPGFSKLAHGATPGPMRRKIGRPSKIPVAQKSLRTAKETTSRFVPGVQAASLLKTVGRPNIAQSTCPSPSSLQSGVTPGTERGIRSERRAELVQSVQENQENRCVLCLYTPVKQMGLPIVAISISVSLESTERLGLKLEHDYDGHRFALDQRFPVRFRATTAKINVIFSPVGYEVIPKQRPTEITQEEVFVRSADDLPAYIVFQIERQCIRVDQRNIRVRLCVNGLDRVYVYEPLILVTTSSPSALQPQETWINVIAQHLHNIWYELGINLGLNDSELRSIRRRHSDDIGRCRSVIKKWANKNETLTNATAIRQLIEVVRNFDESGDLADLLEVTAEQILP